jgi:hypothetical protein
MVLDAEPACREEQVFATGRRTQCEPPRERRAASGGEQETSQNRRHWVPPVRTAGQNVATESSVWASTSPDPCISGSPPRFTAGLFIDADRAIVCDVRKGEPAACGFAFVVCARPCRRTGEHCRAFREPPPHRGPR